ncbi:MAG: ATP-dependent Clp protease proteolytic subunit [Verrucomicrobiota bacterium]
MKPLPLLAPLLFCLIPALSAKTLAPPDKVAATPAPQAIVTTPAPVVPPVAATPGSATLPTPSPVAEKPKEKSPREKELDAKREEQEALSIENKLEAERLLKETTGMRAEITRLKTERELITERQSYEAAKRQVEMKEKLTGLVLEKEKITREGELARARAEKLANDLKVAQSEAALEVSRLQGEIARIEARKKRGEYTGGKPIYLENPLRDDGILVISDRRIPLNGPITSDTADFVTERIHYWNNMDDKLPIFIVIDSSPGGSVMAGYRILKAMESSKAPMHVVVKSFAASMAAAITTLASESYAYPNAVLLHHQISSTVFGQLNLTQQKEFARQSERWWKRLGYPIAGKMGISADDMVKRMYAHSSDGDWSEFAEDAQKIKWVKHIVKGIEESSFTKDPDAKRDEKTEPAKRPSTDVMVGTDADGRPFAMLPRLEAKDVWFLYNPDRYYRAR